MNLQPSSPRGVAVGVATAPPRQPPESGERRGRPTRTATIGGRRKAAAGRRVARPNRPDQRYGVGLGCRVLGANDHFGEKRPRVGVLPYIARDAGRAARRSQGHHATDNDFSCCGGRPGVPFRADFRASDVMAAERQRPHLLEGRLRSRRSHSDLGLLRAYLPRLCRRHRCGRRQPHLSARHAPCLHRAGFRHPPDRATALTRRTIPALHRSGIVVMRPVGLHPGPSHPCDDPATPTPRRADEGVP